MSSSSETSSNTHKLSSQIHRYGVRERETKERNRERRGEREGEKQKREWKKGVGERVREG